MATPFFPTNQPLFITTPAQISASGIFTTISPNNSNPSDPVAARYLSSSIFISSSTFEIFNSRSFIYYNDGTSPTYTSGVRPTGAGNAALGALPLLCNLNSISKPNAGSLTTSNPSPNTAETTYTRNTQVNANDVDVLQIQWNNFDGFNPNQSGGSTYITSLTQISNQYNGQELNQITLKLNFSTNPNLSQSLYNGRLDVSAVWRLNNNDAAGIVRASDIINFYDTPPQSDIAILNGTTINNITWTPGSTNNYSCEFTFNQPTQPSFPGINYVAFLLRLSFDTQLDIPPIIDYPELHLDSYFYRIILINYN